MAKEYNKNPAAVGALSPAVGLSLGGALVALSSPRTAFLVVGLGAALTTIAFVRVNLDAATGPMDAPRAPEAPDTRQDVDAACAGNVPMGESSRH